MSLEIKKTDREFGYYEFHDCYDVECSLQKSSLATEDAIWFGINNPDPKQLVNGQWASVEFPEGTHFNKRMHLTRSQVKELLPILKQFVKTGEIS